MKKTAATGRRKTMALSRPHTPSNPPPIPLSTSVQKNVSKSSSSANRYPSGPSQRKASTPTHDKPTGPVSPDISHIMPTEISTIEPSKEVTVRKPTSRPASKPTTASDKEISLADQLDFEYTRYLQTMFRRKLSEAEACDVDDKLTALQKRMAENMNILQKTTERLKNITFNKEVDALHKMCCPNYGHVLETLNNANCKEYLETMNKKLEQNQNQLKMKNIYLPDGGTTELAQIISETVAACEKLKANNNLELPKVMAEVKASNNSTSEALSRCLDLLPEVEDVMLDRATLEICPRNEE